MAVLAVQLIPFLHFDLVVLYLVQILKGRVQQMKLKTQWDKTLLLIDMYSEKFSTGKLSQLKYRILADK